MVLSSHHSVGTHAALGWMPRRLLLLLLIVLVLSTSMPVVDALTCSGSTLGAQPSVTDAFSSITGCTLTGTVSFAVPSMPAIGTAPTLGIAVTSSTLASGVVLAIRGSGSAAVLATHGPLLALIQGNAYTNGNVNIYGAFPPRTNITIIGNTGRCAFAAFPSINTPLGIEYLLLAEYSTLTVRNNTFEGSGNLYPRGIAVRYGPNLKHYSALLFDGNRITATAATVQGEGIGLCFSSVLMVDNNSRYEVTRNAMLINNPGYYVLGIFYESCTTTISQTSTFLVEGNTLFGAGTFLRSIGLDLSAGWSTTVSGSSIYAVRDNTVDVTATTRFALLEHNGPLTIGTGSRYTVSNNRAFSRGGAAPSPNYLLGFIQAVGVSGAGSRIEVLDNALSCTGTNGRLIQESATLTVSAGGRFIVRNNALGCGTAIFSGGLSAPPAPYSRGPEPTTSAAGYVYACNNSVAGRRVSAYNPAVFAGAGVLINCHIITRSVSGAFTLSRTGNQTTPSVTPSRTRSKTEGGVSGTISITKLSPTTTHAAAATNTVAASAGTHTLSHASLTSSRWATPSSALPPVTTTTAGPLTTSTTTTEATTAVTSTAPPSTSSAAGPSASTVPSTASPGPSVSSSTGPTASTTNAVSTTTATSGPPPTSTAPSSAGAAGTVSTTTTTAAATSTSVPATTTQPASATTAAACVNHTGVTSVSSIMASAVNRATAPGAAGLVTVAFAVPPPATVATGGTFTVAFVVSSLTISSPSNSSNSIPAACSTPIGPTTVTCTLPPQSLPQGGEDTLLDAVVPAVVDGCPVVLRLRIMLLGRDTESQQASIVLEVARVALPAAVLAYIFDPTAAEPAMATAVLLADCAVPVAGGDIARIAKYLLNPFTGAGRTSAGAALVGLVVGVWAVHVAAAVLWAWRGEAATRQRSFSGPLRRAQFPAVPFAVSIAMGPGVAWGCGAAINAGETAWGAVVMVCALFLVCLPAAAALIVFRGPALTFVRRRQGPPSSLLQRCVRSVGVWFTDDAAEDPPQRPVRWGVAANAQPGYRLAPMLNAWLLAVLVAALAVAPPASTSCAARHYALAAICWINATLMATTRPHTVPGVSLLSAAGIASLGATCASVAAKSQSATFAFVLLCAVATLARTALAIFASTRQTVIDGAGIAADFELDSPRKDENLVLSDNRL